MALSPEARAKADLLWYQTQGADIANQGAAQGVANEQNRIRSIPGVTNTFDMNAQPNGGVAGAVTSLAQPPAPVKMVPGPGGRMVVDTSGMTPFQQYLASQPKLTPEDVNLGQSKVLGPTNTYAAQAARGAPRAIGPSESLVLDPTKGNAPGNVVTGTVDPATLQAEAAQRASAQKDADMRAALASTATNTETDLITARKMYNDLVGATDPQSVLTEGAIRFLASKTGLPIEQLSNPIMAKLAIKRLLTAAIGSSLQAIQGDTNNPIRGILQPMSQYLPDPETMNDTQFNAAIDQMLKVTARQKEEGGPARLFQTSAHSKADADAYYHGLEALRSQHDQENAAAAASGAGPGQSAQVYIFPDQASAEAALKAGHFHRGDRIKIGSPSGPGFTVGD
jgi:hypothetical protein